MSDINEGENPLSEPKYVEVQNSVSNKRFATAQVEDAGKVLTRKHFLESNKEVVPIALKEPIWEQQAAESDEDYGFLKSYMFCARGGRHKRSLRQFFDSMNLSQTSFDLRLKAKIWSWEVRAQAWEKYEIDRKVDTFMTAGVSRVERARAASEELIAIVAEKAVTLLKEQDEKKLIEFAPYVSILFGPGGAGKFILDGYKAIFGDKLNVDGNFKVGPLEWKPLNGRQPISQ